MNPRITDPTANNPKLAYSIPQFCEAASIGRTQTYSFIKSGELIARKMGKRTVIAFEDAKRFINGLPIIADSSDKEAS